MSSDTGKIKLKDLETDLTLYYIQASSASNEGILSAFQKLFFASEGSLKRKTYGLFRPENGTIVYKACAEEQVKGEFQNQGLPVIILRKGKYKGIEIQNCTKNKDQIESVFIELLKDQDFDTEGYCVEEYGWNDEVFCMVRLRE